MNTELEEAKLVFEKFLEKNYEKELLDILENEEEFEHYALRINALELFDTNLSVSSQLLKEPLKLLPVFDEAARSKQKHMIEEKSTGSELVLKLHCHVRVSNLPICPELTRDKLPKSQDVGCFLAITGCFCC